jgi:hypothetical protein
MTVANPRDPDFDIRELRFDPETHKETKEGYEKILSQAKRDFRKERKECGDEYTYPSDRELEVAFAIGTDMPILLSAVLKHEGSVRGSVRHINNVLQDMPKYDVEKYGLVSTPTFYNWVEKWADSDDSDDVLKSYSR